MGACYSWTERQHLLALVKTKENPAGRFASISNCVRHHGSVELADLLGSKELCEATGRSYTLNATYTETEFRAIRWAGLRNKSESFVVRTINETGLFDLVRRHARYLARFRRAIGDK